jgi:mannose-1-phosphate guanylyltransferase
MDQSTRSDIRHIFLSPRPNFALMTAANLLGMTLKELKREIEDGVIVAVSTALGQRMTKEELTAAAMQKWEHAVIEEALGEDAAAVLPEAIRLVELRARVPRYQREMLRVLARQEGTSVDAVLTRELEDVASVHAEELAAAMPELAMAMAWP